MQIDLSDLRGALVELADEGGIVPTGTAERCVLCQRFGVDVADLSRAIYELIDLGRLEVLTRCPTSRRPDAVRVL
jgi:hypothetical protein